MQFWSDMLQQHPINVVSKANVCIVQCDPLTHVILRNKSKDKIVNEQWTFKLELSSLKQIFTINCEQREHILCYDRFQQTADMLFMRHETHVPVPGPGTETSEQGGRSQGGLSTLFRVTNINNSTICPYSTSLTNRPANKTNNLH